MTTLAELLSLLDLEEADADVFRGRSPEAETERVFGGQVAGQALVAAGRTVSPERSVHSLHAYFLRPGDPNAPILYHVDRIRDGGSFTTRRVVAIQHRQAIFNLAASFQVDEAGFDHQLPAQPAPPPGTLPTLAERVAAYRDHLDDWYTRPRPIDIRHVYDPPHAVGGRDPRAPCQQVWARADGTLPDDRLLHACVLTYASDMTLLDPVLLVHGTSWLDASLVGASLDHAMWFHRPFRADEWLLFEQESPSASGGRGLGQARVFTEEGVHVVSVVQEGMFRRRRP